MVVVRDSVTLWFVWRNELPVSLSLKLVLRLRMNCPYRNSSFSQSSVEATRNQNVSLNMYFLHMFTDVVFFLVVFFCCCNFVTLFHQLCFNALDTSVNVSTICLYMYHVCVGATCTRTHKCTHKHTSTHARSIALCTYCRDVTDGCVTLAGARLAASPRLVRETWRHRRQGNDDVGGECGHCLHAWPVYTGSFCISLLPCRRCIHKLMLGF